jgi:hypothetical protein
MQCVHLRNRREASGFSPLISSNEVLAVYAEASYDVMIKRNVPNVPVWNRIPVIKSTATISRLESYFWRNAYTFTEHNILMKYVA